MPILASSPRIFFIVLVLAYVIDVVEDCMPDKRGHDNTESGDDRKNPKPDEKSVHYSSSSLRLIHSRSVWILASDSESLSAS